MSIRVARRCSTVKELHHTAMAQEDAIGRGHQAVLLIVAQLGDELNIEQLLERLVERLGQVALVAKGLP